MEEEGKQSRATDSGSTKSISKGHPLKTEEGGDRTDSFSSLRRIARSLPEFNKEEEVPKDTQHTHIHHTDFSRETEEYSGEQEGLQSHCWGVGEGRCTQYARKVDDSCVFRRPGRATKSDTLPLA